MQGYYCADESAHVYMYKADALSLLKTVPKNWVHAIITDPPYGLSHLGPGEITQALKTWFDGDREKVPVGKGFMGRDWDSFVPPPAVWDECYRVLKPGGYMAVFAGTRTFDIMALSIRLAGFEIRDTVEWIYGSGFPKSQNISKMMDKQAGAERTVVGNKITGNALQSTSSTGEFADGHHGGTQIVEITANATDQAKEWDGWGTALKPAHEPIIIARKPLSEKTVAKNVLAHGTGGINIDATRVEGKLDGDPDRFNKTEGGSFNKTEGGAFKSFSPVVRSDGRWPANVVLSHSSDCVLVGTREVKTGTAVQHNRAGEKPASVYGKYQTTTDDQTYGNGGKEKIDSYKCADDCAVAELNDQSGSVGAAAPVKGNEESQTGESGIYGLWGRVPGSIYNDQGGASRFFNGFRYQAKASRAERPKIDDQSHPTVKPLGLMQWLVRLLVPEQGCVLDPFAGTGTTLEAARKENKRAVGIDFDEFSCQLTAKRLGVSDEPVDP